MNSFHSLANLDPPSKDNLLTEDLLDLFTRCFSSGNPHEQINDLIVCKRELCVVDLKEDFSNRRRYAFVAVHECVSL